MADLDEDEYGALLDAVQAKQREASWTSLHEVLAAAVEALWTIIARLDAGIAVVQVQRTQKAKDYGRYPRPTWLEAEGESGSDEPVEIVVTNLREAFRLLKGGRDG